MRLTKAQRETVRTRFGGFCAYCGQLLGQRWHADHVEAVVRVTRYDRQRGKFVKTGEVDWPERDTIDNLFPACPPCNIYKGVFGLEEFRRQLQNLTGVLERSNSSFRNAVRFGFVEVRSTPLTFHFEKVALPSPPPADEETGK